jgi:RHS repeat-associated protein
MAKETVTKSKRFYCKSLTPDICKTPMGSAVVPRPYNIIGEFKDAQAASPSVKTHTEPVILHQRSFIPSIKGDAKGVLGGVKSQTFLNTADTLGHSSTKGSNNTETVQVGRTVWMNAKNTIGKIYERTGKKMRDMLTPYAKEWKDNVSQSVHGFGEVAMAKGGTVAAAGGVAAAAGGVATATGVGAAVGVPLAVGGAATATVGGVTAGVGAGAKTAASALDVAADYVLTGKMPDIAGPAMDTVISIIENMVARKLPIPGLKNKLDQLKSKRSTAKPEQKKDGGKTEKPKEEPKDKPSDCCPGNSAPGNKPVKSSKPTHYGTGEEILHQTDFVLESAHPFVWTRCYRSGSELGDWGLLGARWATPYTASLFIDASGIVFHESTGRALRLPTLAVGESYDHQSDGFILTRDDDVQFSLTWRDGTVELFRRGPDAWLPHGHQGVNAMLPAGMPSAAQRYLLAFSTARDEKYFSVEHFHDAKPGEALIRIHAIDGQIIEAIRDERALEDSVSYPMPPRICRVEELRSDGSRICHVRYQYQTEPLEQELGPNQPENTQALTPRERRALRAHSRFEILPRRYNLIAQTNLTGEQRTYRYHHHLLMEYSNYSGFMDGLDWISLDALSARWAGDQRGLPELAEQYPVTLANSYQARAISNLTSDGNGQVKIDYIAPFITQVIEPHGGVLEYKFNSQWLCTHVDRISADGKRQSFGRRDWSPQGHLLADIDAQGNATRYSYDTAGNLCSVTDAKGRTTQITYNEHNLPVRVIDPLGHVTERLFDAQGQISKSINPLGHSTLYNYDAEGRLTSLTDAKGGTKLLTYDQAGRLTSYTDCSQITNHYAYDTAGRLSHTTDALGQVQRYEYDALGRPTHITYADQTSEKYTYDSDGNLLTHTDAKGLITRYAYNGHGLPVERIDSKGQLLRYAYDKALRLVQLTNGNSEAYRLAYDVESRLISETGFDGKVTNYTYDTAGQLIASECQGQRTDYMRDATGQLEARVTPDGITRYAYDALDRLSAIANPQAEHHFFYDAAGQLIEERMAYMLHRPGRAPRVDPHPLTQAQRWADTSAHASAVFALTHAYDELGNRIQTTLPNGRRIDTLRYGSGHWHGTLWQGQSIVDIERDHLHREVRREAGPTSAPQAPSLQASPLSNSNGHSQGNSLSYGDTSSPLNPQQSRAARLVTTRQYDLQSRLIDISQTRADRILRSHRYSYDDNGQLTDIHDSRYGHSHYRYDPIGQLLAAVQPHIRESFAFDPAGNLLDSLPQENPPTNSRTKAKRSATDNNAALSATLTDDSTLAQAAGAALVQATQNAANDEASSQSANSKPQPAASSKKSTAPRLSPVTYNLLRRYLGNAYEYDRQGNTVLKYEAATTGLLSPSANQSSQTRYSYDADNRLIRATRIWDAAPVSAAATEIASALKTQQITHYLYDAFGRRIAKQVSQPHPVLDIVSAEQPSGAISYETTVFLWDGDTLLQEISAQRTASYLYEPGSFIPLARIESAQGLAHYSMTDSWTHSNPSHPPAYAHLPTPARWQPLDPDPHNAHLQTRQHHLARQRERRHRAHWKSRLQQAQQDAASDQIYHYHCDHLGTPQELTDSTGQSVWAARYKAWGRVLRYEQRQAEQPLRFQGQYEDAETGLYYNRHRYYDPDQARYITPDPIGLLGGLNSYQYAPNPLQWVDPLGLAKGKNKSASGCDPCCGKDPAKEAQSWQGTSATYPGVDKYRNIVMKKGTTFYSLYSPLAGVRPPGFAVTGDTLRRAGGDVQKYYRLTQVSLDPGTDSSGRPRTLRTEVQEFTLTEDLCVAVGKARKNPQFGYGGATQYFISPSNVGKLVPGATRPI